MDNTLDKARGPGLCAARLLLALGYQTRLAALTLFFFLIPTTLIFHAFWAGTLES